VSNCIVLDGKKVAQDSSQFIREKSLKLFKIFKRKPCLAAIIVGDDPASHTYISMKEKACEDHEIITNTYKMSDASSTTDIIELITDLNLDESIDGILLQHPVPEHIDELKCFNTIDISKDVDGVTTLGFGNMFMNQDSFKSCTPFGIMRLLEAYDVKLEGLNALVIGRSQILGKPMAGMLLNKNATVTIAHSKTKNLDRLISESDLVVAAVGIPKFISAHQLKSGSILIDAGYHPSEKCGDVELAGIESVVSAYTPVPGGVGPMTINTLILNTVSSMEAKFNVE
tara:strand:- start:66 stop:920 length:855 start_codon:yes stop_codon:yes gene_type:complete